MKKGWYEEHTNEKHEVMMLFREKLIVMENKNDIIRIIYILKIDNPTNEREDIFIIQYNEILPSWEKIEFIYWKSSFCFRVTMQNVHCLGTLIKPFELRGKEIIQTEYAN